MTDYIYLGPTPTHENCAQVGAPDYTVRAIDECKRYIALLRKKMGPEPEGARLMVKAQPHDFGTYHEVVCQFDSENEEAMNYAYRCENDGPTHWE